MEQQKASVTVLRSDLALLRLEKVAKFGPDVHTPSWKWVWKGIMSRRDKLIGRLKSRPKDFTWDELVRLLEGLDYAEATTGKTGCSRRRFLHASAPTITLHRPHPGNIVKMYVIDNVLRVLIEEGLI